MEIHQYWISIFRIHTTMNTFLWRLSNSYENMIHDNDPESTDTTIQDPVDDNTIEPVEEKPEVQLVENEGDL